MANPFRKLPPHSPVTAFSLTAWNRMLDMLDWWKTRGPAGSGPLRGLTDWDQTVFRARNDTYTDLASYAVVGINGPIWAPSVGEAEFLTRTSIKVVVPVVGTHANRWGVMLEATPAGVIGRCCLAGVVPVRVYVTATTDPCCDVIDVATVDGETTYLGTGGSGAGGSGAQVLWLEDGATAETIAWAIVRLGGAAQSTKYGKVDALWTETSAADGSAVVSIWTWDTGTSAWVDSGDDETVYAPPQPAAWKIAAAAWLKLEYHAQAQCWLAWPVAPYVIQGNLDGDLAAGGTQTITIFGVDYAVEAPYVLASLSIASGKRVEAMLDANGDYIVRWAEC